MSYMLTIFVSLRRPSNEQPMRLMRLTWERLEASLFPVECDRWLAVLRVGLGLQVTIYALSSRADWNELFAKNGQGLINRELTEAYLNAQSPLAPRLGWLISIGNHFGLSEATVLWSAWACLLAAGCLLLPGILSRPAAVTAWFVHLCAVKSEQFLSYGMDNFTTIGLFYLMLSPLPDRYSLDWRWRRAESKKRHLLGFFRRVLQVHLCFIYFLSGITKSTGMEWWDGTSVWQILTSPPFNLVSPEFLIPWKYLLPFFGIAVCLMEIGYPILIWPKKTRAIWLACVIGMHVTIGLTMGLYLFSLIMITLNIAGFGPDWAFTWKAAAASCSASASQSYQRVPRARAGS
jgi:HTTM domain